MSFGNGAAPPINQYANLNNYASTKTIVSAPGSLTGWGVILILGQSNMAQYMNYVPPVPTNASKIRQFTYSDGTLRAFGQEPYFDAYGKVTLAGSIHSNHVLDGLASTATLTVGMNVQGFGLAANTTVVAIPGVDTVFISPNALATTGPSNYDFAALISTFMGQLADNLISDGTFPNGVILCETAIGGTLASEWSPSGQYHSVIVTALKRLRGASLPITAIILGQGETETFLSIPGSVWAANWTQTFQVIRNFGVTAPIFVAKETHNIGIVSPSVQAAQVAIRNGVDILAGPDADARGNDYRFDLTHFGLNAGSGLNGSVTMARDWADVLGAHF